MAATPTIFFVNQESLDRIFEYWQAHRDAKLGRHANWKVRGYTENALDHCVSFALLHYSPKAL